MFNTKPIQEQPTQGIQVIEKPNLYTIDDLTEQADFQSAIRLLQKFNFNSIPDNFIYKDSLILKEQIEKDEDDIVYRKDYVITPKKGVRKLSGERLAIDASLSLRFDDILGYLNNEGYTRDLIFGEDADIKRYLTANGDEVYTYKGIEILEVRTDICKKCKDCNEKAPGLTRSGDQKAIHTSSHERIVRGIREYKINPPLLGLLFGTGVNIAELTHPCQLINLQEILDPGYNLQYKTADPPKIKIVFPKQ